MKDLVLCNKENNEIYTTSRIIADEFGKLHKNVLSDIRNIISSTKDLDGNTMFIMSSL